MCSFRPKSSEFESNLWAGDNLKNLTRFGRMGDRATGSPTMSRFIKPIYRPYYHAYSEDECRGMPFVSPSLPCGGPKRAQERGKGKEGSHPPSHCRLLSASSRRLVISPWYI